ncbi:conserved hypothetical protein [Cupriavidus taiwanensis]|uniref:Preprotein translocase subunit SecA n=1 Tax=Cupriavidus taiwanensis TaxID=164546 RepID=A0A375JAR7_9BURK|nr:conserved hypothetical protein [Cupriavidus taiwanensis]
MLSPHEIAALMILRDSESTRELDPADISALVERQLVRLETSRPDGGPLRLTIAGQRIVNAVDKRR